MSTSAAATDLTELHGYQLRLPSFEGPLDVLLRLIERERLSISEVSLVTVTDQFLAHFASLEDADPAAIASFTNVAGRLLVLKSRSLLPRPAQPEEEDDPDDLVRQLAEYKAVKEAALRLAETDRMGLGAYPRGVVPRPEPGPVRLAMHQPAALARALRRRLLTLAPPSAPLALRQVVSLQAMIGRAIAALAGRKPVPFRSIVGIEAGRQETLVGFLAVLVLLRRRVVDADQPEPFGEITLLPIEGATIDADLAGADLA